MEQCICRVRWTWGLLELRAGGELAAYMQVARGLWTTASVAGAVKHVSYLGMSLLRGGGLVWLVE